MKWRKFLPVIGLLILGYLIYSIGLDRLYDSLIDVNMSILIASLFVLPLITIFQTFKWKVLLEKQGFENLSFGYLFKIQWISVFYGAVTPGKIGSLIKAVYLRDKTKRPLGECMSNIVIDRFLDFLTITFLAIIGSLFLVKEFSNLYIQVIGLFVLLLAGLIVLSNKKRMGFCFNLFYKFLVSKKIKERLEDGFHSFYANLPGFRKLFLPFILTIGVWVLIYTQAYFVALAFSIKIPYLPFITIFPIGTIVGLIPITISGLGTRELTLVSLFKIFEVSADKIIAMSLVWTFASFLFTLGGWILSIRKEEKEITEDL